MANNVLYWADFLFLVHLKKIGYLNCLIICFPFVLVFGFVSSQDGFSHHFRYILPGIPYPCLISGAFCFIFYNKYFINSLAIFFSVFLFLVCFFISPHFMSFYNYLVGGPSEGWHYLADSNSDWGQDFIFLKDWIYKNKPNKIRVQYYGLLQPKNLGLNVEDIPVVPQPGWFAISINYIAGSSFGLSHSRMSVKGPYTYFQYFNSVDSIGYSIRIYFISESECNRVRKLLGLPAWEPK